MPKSSKSKRSSRWNPMARGDGAAAMKTDDTDPTDQAPRLNAHQQRHLERKRLQAEMVALRSATRKVSKADKVQHKKDKKALQRGLQQTRKQAKALGRKSRSPVEAMESAPRDDEEVDMDAEPQGGSSGSVPDVRCFVFNLPPPVPGKTSR